VPIRRATLGETRRVGALRWTVIGPRAAAGGSPGDRHTGHDVDSAAENDASIVLRVESGALTMLLTGDVEPAGQAALLAASAALDVDVLKVPHHGSRQQDDRFIAATSPALALISAGAGNDYGHPAPETLELLQASGARVVRTDRAGTVLVVATPAGPAVLTKR
jgi:competence protein ComEC